MLAIPAGVLTGLAFASGIMAYAATLKNSNGFNSLYRFILTPLFLFSGIFFPITRLPPSLQVLATFTPLFHGVALIRDLTLDTVGARTWVIHVAYLVGMFVVGAAAAVRTIDRALHK
jgi:lipooligosaccharide transport system permease protein